MVEYWYVEYNEQKVCDFGHWKKLTTCIARHPDVWLKCKQDFESARCECGVNVRQTMLFEVTDAIPISKEDYDLFIRAVRIIKNTETKRSD